MPTTEKVWTIPFKIVYGLRHPSEHLQDLVQDYFGVKCDAEHFFKKLTVHKLDSKGTATLGYFPSTITREGDLKLNSQKNFTKFERFAYDALPHNITPDLQKIIRASDDDESYVEIVEELKELDE